MTGFRMKRGFTLVELLVIVAIICAMAGVGVMSVRGGQGAARVKGATRDVFAAIRHARSQALVTQKPVVITYSTAEVDGEVVAKIETTSARLFSSGVDRAKIQKLTGGPLPPLEAEESDAAAPVKAKAADAKDAAKAAADAAAAAASGDGGSLVEDVLFAPISEEVVRGMRVKVVKAEDDPGVTGERKTRVSIFSNVDYLLGKFSRYNEQKKSEAAQAGDVGASSSGAKKGDDAEKGEAQEPVSFVWETNGRVEPHRVWIYADGQRPEDGLSIRIDRFGAAKVLTGSGEEGD